MQEHFTGSFANDNLGTWVKLQNLENDLELLYYDTSNTCNFSHKCLDVYMKSVNHVSPVTKAITAVIIKYKQTYNYRAILS